MSFVGFDIFTLTDLPDASPYVSSILPPMYSDFKTSTGFDNTDKELHLPLSVINWYAYWYLPAYNFPVPMLSIIGFSFILGGIILKSFASVLVIFIESNLLDIFIDFICPIPSAQYMFILSISSYLDTTEILSGML